MKISVKPNSRIGMPMKSPQKTASKLNPAWGSHAIGQGKRPRDPNQLAKWECG
jgi:hypothetical protein